MSGSLSPHYDSEAQRRPTYHRLIGGGDIPAGYAFEDGVAGHFVDGVLKGVVSSRPKAKGYYVEQVDDHAQETVLDTLYLGLNLTPDPSPWGEGRQKGSADRSVLLDIRQGINSHA